MIRFGLSYFAQRNPQASAVIEPGGRVWSRSELGIAVNQIAHALRERGLKERDVIAVLAPNCIEFVATYLAATDIGLYVVPINWHLSVQEVSYILENSGAGALVAHERFRPLIDRVREHRHGALPAVLVSLGQIPGFTTLEDLRSGMPTERVANPVVGRMMMYTSATTGRPKAIEVPIRDAALAMSKTVDFHIGVGLRLEDDNVHLCASMMYHAAPLEFVAIALHMGHTIVLVERWDPEQLLHTIQQHRVTTSFMVPTMFVRLLKLPKETRDRYDTSSLRLVSHSAAPCPEEVKRQLIEWWGPIIWESYGAAEGQGTAVTSQEWLERPGTVGRPILGTKLRILDDDGNELPPGVVGTIFLSRHTGDRFEYRGDAEKTRAAYRGDVFTVGDLGYLDDEGYLYICDRRVDLIICSGTNIYPAEVEQILVQHPKVLDCAVFGVPDELSGESVHAVIQPVAGVIGEDELTADIISFLRQRLSVTKIPRRIEYASALPRDPNGKLYKRALRDKHWAGRAKNI